MYRVGFGDCFLVSFPGTGGPSHVLVDCGVHSRGDIKTMPQVVRNVIDESGGRLAIVIATHEHQDHLSGFASCADQFTRIKVGEVWLPWVLDGEDRQADKLRRARLRLAQDLWMRLAAAGNSSVKSIVLNMVGNERALELLRTELGVKPRYLEAGMQLAAPGGIRGLTVKILGPPRDLEFLAKMDPPANNHYLAGDGMPSMNGRPGGLVPFHAHWRLTPEQFRARATIAFSRAEEERVADAARGRIEPLAAALDKIVNNTSLVALMSFAGRNLLFAGDAQWGNWYWAEQKEALLETLADIDFYKVAHHGSYNATPKDALEAMPAGKFAAMVSTQSEPWPSIPRKPLIDELQQRTGQRLVRSDAINVAEAAPAAVPMPKLPEQFTVGDFWADYSIPV